MIHTDTEPINKVNEDSTPKSCQKIHITEDEPGGEDKRKKIDETPMSKPHIGDEEEATNSIEPTSVATSPTANSTPRDTTERETGADNKNKKNDETPMIKPQNGDTGATTPMDISSPKQDTVAVATSSTTSNPSKHAHDSTPCSTSTPRDEVGAASTIVSTITAVNSPAASTTISSDTHTPNVPQTNLPTREKAINSKNEKNFSNLTNKKYDRFIYADEESDDEKGSVVKTKLIPNHKNNDPTKKTVNTIEKDANGVEVIEQMDVEKSSSNERDNSQSTHSNDNLKSTCTTLTTVTQSKSITAETTTVANKDSLEKGSKNLETEREETSWEKVLLDAEEFESLMFSIRRPTARNRLQMLVKQMKQLSAKLKRHHEVMYVLRATELAKKETGNKRKANPTDSINRNDVLPNDKATSSGDTSGGNENVICMNTDKVGSKRIKLDIREGTNNSKVSETNKTQVDIPLFAMDRTARPNASHGTTSSGTPILKEKDKFVHHHRFGSDLHCPDFDATGKCPLGAICHHLHVYRPPSNITIKIRKCYTRDDLKRAYETQRKITLTRVEFSEKIKADALNVPKYTLGFTCPIDKTIYYAQPFPSDKVHNALTQNGGGAKSIQGVWWYRNMKEASEALSTIVLEDLIRRKVINDRFQPERTMSGDGELHRKKNASARAAVLARTACVDNAPVLKQTRVAQVGLPQIHPWNWMEVHYEARCIAFHSVRGCNRGMRCRNAHVHYPTPKLAGASGGHNGKFPDLGALPKAYYQNFGIILEDPFFRGEGGDVGIRGRSISSFKTKSAVDVRNQIWYTAAWKCPHEGTIYYAAGGACGRVNSQNMFLYPSVEQAKLAACGVVLDGFENRGMKGYWEVSDIPLKSITNSRARMLSLSPTRNRIPASTQDQYWLDGKPVNHGLIPHWQPSHDCAVVPQPQVRSVDRDVRYAKSDLDPRLPNQVTSLCSSINGGDIEVSRMRHQQIRISENMTGDDQGLEKELFG